MADVIAGFRDLRVYKTSMAAAMELFEVSKAFPGEERFSLTDQVRRSSRSVCANIAEAWRKRRYPAAFVAKLSDAEAEAAETQVWIEFAVRCHYLETKQGRVLNESYEKIIAQIVRMLAAPEKWGLPRKS